jgi:predicted MFS family arabinose efflux permease
VSPRTVLRPYVSLFAVPGSRLFSFVGWLARLPMPMVGLGAVLLVAGETGSYGLAGAVAGTLALAGSVAGPQWARAMDRGGQGAILRWAMVGYLVFGVGFAVAVIAGAPRWSWFVLGGLTGAFGPSIGSLIRARWAAVLDAERRPTAFALESVIDEVVFVVGPPLVTVLATLISPATGFLTGILIAVAGGLWLSTLRDTEPPLHEPEPGAPARRSAALSGAVLLVCAAYLAVGGVFGAIDVVVVAFAQAEGAAPFAGVALSCYAGGSLVAGLVYGLLRLPGTLAARYVGTAVAFAVAAQLMLLVGSIGLLVPIAFVAGMAIAPVLISGTSLVESRVPRAALTEALTWTTTGLTLGVTAGSALAGAAVDAWGAESAFAVPALAAGLAGVIALLGAPLLVRTRKADRAAEPLPAAGSAG